MAKNRLFCHERYNSEIILKKYLREFHNDERLYQCWVFGCAKASKSAKHPRKYYKIS